jgi:signal transduction histidine kinase/ActR/RegA family two-component response regulator
VVLCTTCAAHSRQGILQRLGKADGLVVLKKPFDHLEVSQLAQAMTEKWRLAREVGERTAQLEADSRKLRSEIADQIRLERQLHQARKMEAVGQLAAGVAHDFNNVLAVVQAHTSRLLAGKALDSPDYPSLQTIAAAANRAAALVRQLLTFSRNQVIQLRPLTVRDALAAVTAMLPRMLGQTITVKVNAPAPLLCLNADAGMLGQILMNLAANARDAMPQGGVLSLSAEPVEIGPSTALENREARLGQFVCFSVSDTGCGIPPELLPRLFEPFFTTQPAGQGLGLGLAMVYGLAKQHNGWVHIQSQPGRGSTVRVFIPVFTPAPIPAADALPPAPAAGSSQGGDETILVVDDEAEVCGFVAEVLRSCGYNVFSAESGKEALEVWAQMDRKFHLLLTDIVMPGGLSGCQLAARLLAQDPALRVIYTSGYAPGAGGQDVAWPEARDLLPKPYEPAILLRRVRASLDGHSVAA